MRSKTKNPRRRSATALDTANRNQSMKSDLNTNKNNTNNNTRIAWYDLSFYDNYKKKNRLFPFALSGAFSKSPSSTQRRWAAWLSSPSLLCPRMSKVYTKLVRLRIRG